MLTGLRSLGWSLHSALPDPSAPVGCPRPPETHHRLRHWCPRDACGSHHLPRLSVSSLCAPHPQPAARILAFPPLRCLSNPSLRPCPGRLSGSRLGCRLPSGPLAALTPSGSAAASCPRVSGLSSRNLRPSPGLAKPPAVPFAVPFALPTPQRTERLGGPCLQARPFRSSSACSPCPRVPVPSSPLLQLACPKAGPHFWALPL